MQSRSGKAFPVFFCSNCHWQFKPEGQPEGDTIAEMIENFNKKRDKEFEEHKCEEHR